MTAAPAKPRIPNVLAGRYASAELATLWSPEQKVRLERQLWLAVLRASSCEAQSNGQYHAVRWNLVSGRAVYTNAGRDAELIEPLGVSLLGGHTMAVYWMPGDTAYTVEVYRHRELCA